MCFSKNSYHSTSMEEIAAAANVTKPVIYQHFSSKKRLYADLIREVGNELRDSIRLATENAQTPRQRLANGYEAYFRFACESRAGYELLFGAGPRLDPEFRELLEKIEEEIADLVMSKIDIELDDNHRRFLALGVISLAEGTARRWLASLDDKISSVQSSLRYEDTDASIWVKRVTDLAWAGLRGI